MEGLGGNIDTTLREGLSKRENKYLVNWSGTDPGANMN